MGNVERHQDIKVLIRNRKLDPVVVYLNARIADAETVHQRHEDACSAPVIGWVDTMQRDENARVSRSLLRTLRQLLSEHEERKPKRKFTPPRYNDVYADGMKWLHSLD